MAATGSATYRPIPTFAEWAAMLGGTPDLTLLDEAVDRLRRTRERNGPAAAELAVKRSLLLAALHTGAIEGVHRMNRGVTLTALDNVLDWQRFVEDTEGSDARRQVEAALGTYDLAIDAARDDAAPVTQAWVRRVHEEACAAQDTVLVLHTTFGEQRQTLVRGRYKTAPNHVLLSGGQVHMYAPPADVPAEMHRLAEQLRSTEFSTSHPGCASRIRPPRVDPDPPVPGRQRTRCPGRGERAPVALDVGAVPPVRGPSRRVLQRPRRG